MVPDLKKLTIWSLRIKYVLATKGAVAAEEKGTVTLFEEAD